MRLKGRRYRESFSDGQKQVEGWSTRFEKKLDQQFFKRFGHLRAVRRFTIIWIGGISLLIAGLVVQNLLLGGYFQSLRAVPGGIYNEGIAGTFSNANPIYASTDADNSVASLVFAGLLKYNAQGQLVGNLAKDYSVGPKGLIYTVHLKPGLTWQDGKPLTSADVVFTFQTIQNPDAQSPLQSGWHGIKIAAPDERTVTFTLHDPLASFSHNLTTGIIPRHLLAATPATDLRTADFNTTHPVGAGPFSWQAIRVENTDPAQGEAQIALAPFAGYNGGKPKLQELAIHTYASTAQLSKDFRDKQLTAAEGLVALPPQLKGHHDVQQHNLILRAATMAFFKTSSGVLADQKVRQALVQATDQQSIIKQLGYHTKAVHGPLLTGELADDPSLAQPGFNLKAATSILDAAGWTSGAHGYRQKAGQPLAFMLYAADTPEYRRVANQLSRQWRQVGARASVQLQRPTDFQTTLASHSYDAVLYGITIGSDPDVFVYWDSSQADIRSANRLNLSEYKSSVADAALEAGRTRQDPGLRTIKYKPFLQAWQQDAPAVGLYQPRLLYLTNGKVAGLHDIELNTATDRFINVQNWEIRQAKVTN